LKSSIGAPGQGHRADPGTRRVSRLDENAAATRVQLDHELEQLEAILATHAVVGTRYPEAGMASLGG